MSECVVRMEIPKNCWVCPFGLDGYIWNENDARTHYVRFCSRHSGEEYHVLETDDSDRPWYCDSFICQLPEGHGRLVDFNDVSKELDKYACIVKDETTGMQYMEYPIVLEQNPIRIPTIVPAEAERSEEK